MKNTTVEQMYCLLHGDVSAGIIGGGHIVKESATGQFETSARVHDNFASGLLARLFLTASIAMAIVNVARTSASLMCRVIANPSRVPAAWHDEIPRG